MADLGGDALKAADKAEVAAKHEKRIRAEKARLRRMLREGGIDDERLKGVDRLVSAVAFLATTLRDLEDEINRDGCTSEYQNGENQWGTKQSPAVQSYSSLMQRFLASMKQLLDLLPDSASKPPGDPLSDWVNGKR